MVEHYYTKKPTSPLRTTSVSFLFHSKNMTFLCASGVFSSKKIDTATALLLDHTQVQDGWAVLDLGCGIGVIGISIKKVFPSCAVTLSDVNQRALQFAKKNAKKNSVDVAVVESDLFAGFSEKQFDTIITNPPHHAGRELLYKLIIEAPLYLKSGGVLQFVASHNKGGSMLEKKMKEVFGNVSTLVKKGGFRVYCSRKA